MEDKDKFLRLKINGRLYPTAIMHNYNRFIVKKPEEYDGDPCLIVKNDEISDINDYQNFIATFMNYTSLNDSLMVYHDVGTGKTSKVIFFLNMMFNSNPNLNIFIFIKASLEATWKQQLDLWLSKYNKNDKMENIYFIHFDSPYANRDFENKKRMVDISKRNVYIIDEVHLFISRVISNMSSGKKNSLSIYDSIMEDRKENTNVKLICMSATPAVNHPYELAILFNLLRPGSFPADETTFNKMFIENVMGIEYLNYKMKNLFQRRILGLVSFYKPAGLKGLYASKKVHHLDVVMTEFQSEKYKYFEDYERELDSKRKYSSSNYKSTTFKAYVRRASNFVFPDINQKVNCKTRPKESSFEISSKDLELLNQGLDDKNQLTSIKQAYLETLNYFEKTTEKYFDDIFSKSNVQNDIKNFEKYETFNDYRENEKNISPLVLELTKCSCKYMNFIFLLHKSKRPVLCYINYIILEGLHMLKIYLKYFGYLKYNDKNATDYHKYGDFTGDSSQKERSVVMNIEQQPENVDGKLMKLIFFSSAGTEGISMFSVGEIHILEPFWQEARIEQIIGRGIRKCSHKYVPIEDRHVDIYRYNTIKNKSITEQIEINGKIQIIKKTITDENALKTIDYDIETSAKNKNNVLESFYEAMREAAIDCTILKNHNMHINKYNCFQFEEPSLFEKNIGPAFKENLEDDIKIDNGLNSIHSVLVKVKVIKILGIVDDNANAQPYWYNPESGTIYDYNSHYAIGKIKTDENGYIEKLENNIYKINALTIPLI